MSAAQREADELYQRRHDPNEWAEEAEEVKVKKSRSEVVSFRLPSEDLDRIEEAAAARGQTLSELIREALRASLDGTPYQLPSLVALESSAERLLAHVSHGQWSQQSTSSGSETVSSEAFPDYPPTTQHVVP